MAAHPVDIEAGPLHRALGCALVRALRRAVRRGPRGALVVTVGVLLSSCVTGCGVVERIAAEQRITAACADLSPADVAAALDFLQANAAFAVGDGADAGSPNLAGLLDELPGLSPASADAACLDAFLDFLQR